MMTETNYQLSAAQSGSLPGDVLIVEDDSLIALDYSEVIREFGVESVRIAGTVADALKLIADKVPDFALLDVGLARGKSFEVAERLDDLKVAFAFATGYASASILPPRFACSPVLAKPYQQSELLALLQGWRGKPDPGSPPHIDAISDSAITSSSDRA